MSHHITYVLLHYLVKCRKLHSVLSGVVGLSMLSSSKANTLNISGISLEWVSCENCEM